MSFVTQGPVPPDSPCFAGRAEELKTIAGWCRNLDCYGAVLGARQTGKSSFLLRFRKACKDRYAFVSVSLQGIDPGDLAHAYQHIACDIRKQLPDAGVKGLELPGDGAGFRRFLREAAAQTRAQKVVVALDEYGALPTDTAVKLAHSIRPVFNERFVTEEFQRYFFVLAGATDMLKLTAGDNSPLYNVTESIYLPDLTEAQAEDLLRVEYGAAAAVLAPLIYEWTCGHPYWTQLLASDCRGQTPVDAEGITAIVEGRLQNEDRNLPHLFRGLDERKGGLRAAVKEILVGSARPFSRADPEVAELELLGAVKNEAGRCAIRNRLYEEILQRRLVGAPAAVTVTRPPEGAAAPPPGAGPRVLRLLHLSDSHIQTRDDARNYATQLIGDLKEEQGVKSLDYVILSGDVTDHATPEEYEAAYELVNRILEGFGVRRENLILTPGNHDVSWEHSAAAYSAVPTFKLKRPLGPEYIEAGTAGALLRDEGRYVRRFENYGAFCERLGQSYPERYEEQGVLRLDKANRMVFLSLNSCWELDHYYTERASIHQQGLSQALDRLTGACEGWVKMAVWHHPATGAPGMNDEFLELLSVHGFSVAFHGHIHEATGKLYRYDPKREIHCVGAGTFGAPANQQVTGIPLQYNWIELDGAERQLTVHSRKREKPHGAWAADARWGEKNDPKPWYRIELAGGGRR
jgi:predicted phosphodiesterase